MGTLELSLEVNPYKDMDLTVKTVEELANLWVAPTDSLNNYMVRRNRIREELLSRKISFQEAKFFNDELLMVIITQRYPSDGVVNNLMSRYSDCLTKLAKYLFLLKLREILIGDYYEKFY